MQPESISENTNFHFFHFYHKSQGILIRGEENNINQNPTMISITKLLEQGHVFFRFIFLWTCSHLMQLCFIYGSSFCRTFTLRLIRFDVKGRRIGFSSVVEIEINRKSRFKD